MIGLVNKETGDLETIMPDDMFVEVFPDGLPEDAPVDWVVVPDDHGEGSEWDAASRSFVTGWATVDAEFHYYIDIAAGRFRKRFITTVPGQEMTYLQKRQEAEAFNQGASAADCPMLSAEAAALGVTVADLASTVIAKSTEWEQLGAAIEGLRMKAKQDVTDAATREEKSLAARVDWEALLP